MFCWRDNRLGVDINIIVGCKSMKVSPMIIVIRCRYKFLDDSPTDHSIDIVLGGPLQSDPMPRLADGAFSKTVVS